MALNLTRLLNERSLTGRFPEDHVKNRLVLNHVKNNQYAQNNYETKGAYLSALDVKGIWAVTIDEYRTLTLWNIQTKERIWSKSINSSQKSAVHIVNECCVIYASKPMFHDKWDNVKILKLKTGEEIASIESNDFLSKIYILSGRIFGLNASSGGFLEWNLKGDCIRKITSVPIIQPQWLEETIPEITKEMTDLQLSEDRLVHISKRTIAVHHLEKNEMVEIELRPTLRLLNGDTIDKVGSVAFLHGHLLTVAINMTCRGTTLDYRDFTFCAYDYSRYQVVRYNLKNLTQPPRLLWEDSGKVTDIIVENDRVYASLGIGEMQTQGQIVAFLDNEEEKEPPLVVATDEPISKLKLDGELLIGGTFTKETESNALTSYRLHLFNKFSLERLATLTNTNHPGAIWNTVNQWFFQDGQLYTALENSLVVRDYQVGADNLNDLSDLFKTQLFLSA